MELEFYDQDIARSIEAVAAEIEALLTYHGVCNLAV
jgi:hypothetical protein